MQAVSFQSDGFSEPYYEGRPELKIYGCEGCHQYDPVAYRKNFLNLNKEYVNEYMQELWEKYQEVQNGNGITQEELSNISGLHRNYISDAEPGKRSISLRNIEILSISLNVEITGLFKFEELE
ncbi:helix-turn-helix domain-containing protein [Neisseria lactamica]|uniref:helix-turn-helix domain-containing protein n=1 Tax=Neisseria lactamica TaxID=486 RepID=UPI0019570DB4|nr:helix-turn-helix transcriptional regulator [Neisseria lactamica]